MQRIMMRFPTFWLDKPNNERASLIGGERGAWVRLLAANIPITPARAIPRMSNKPSDIWIPTASRYLRFPRLSRRAYDFFWIPQRFTSRVYLEATPRVAMALISLNWDGKSLECSTHDRKLCWTYLSNWMILCLKWEDFYLVARELDKVKMFSRMLVNSIRVINWNLSLSSLRIRTRRYARETCLTSPPQRI